MIPVKLSFKNFMCYRENVPPLSFEGIHLACLCGDNGNGKSAVFDAITWALWGKARARSNDQLIHAGQAEMEVELEFLAEGQRYRSIRKYSRKTAAGRVSLDLQICDNNEYKSLSGNTMTETQDKIQALLHLDYDTFINSAFLRQGHSNEFSIKEPAKRKDVLANILGLDEYETYEIAAKRLAEQRQAEAETLENSIREVLKELESRQQYIIEGKELETQLLGIQETKQKAELKLKDLREQKSAVQIKMNQLTDLKNRMAREQDDLKAWQEKLENSRRRQDEQKRILAGRENIETQYAEYLKTREKHSELNVKMSRLLELNQQMSETAEAIARESNSLTTEIEKLKEKIKIDEAKAAQLQAVKKEMDEADKKLRDLSTKEKELGRKREQVSSLATEIGSLQPVLKQLDARIEEDREKAKLLHSGESRCPLCGKTLAEHERKDLDNKFLASIEQAQKDKNSTTQELMAKTKQINDLKKLLGSEEPALKRDAEQWQRAATLARKKLEEAVEAKDSAVKLQGQLSPLAQCLENKSYALDARKKQASIQAEIQRNGYDRELHEKLGRELKSLEQYEGLKHALDNAASQIAAEERAAIDAGQAVSRLDDTMKKNTEQSVLILDDMKRLSESVAASEGAEEEYRKVADQEQKVRSDLAVNHERMDRLAAREAEYRKNEVLLKQARFEEQVNRELAEAFSKKGVQALLIKQAFPEIELEANRLLARMTDNRLSLKLESQKELKGKKGEVAETLDIIISDELGTRDYEMFSGGEAFRIDLALRIALSKLLVRRAGAAMPILIIDEGFGTQDSAGRERLVEAIKSIEDDFEKIFVITHLEELKESFPVTITVTKGVDGSMISIN